MSLIFYFFSSLEPWLPMATTNLLLSKITHGPPFPKENPPLCFHHFLLFTYDTQVGLRAKCERETGREVRFESWRKLLVVAGAGTSSGTTGNTSGGRWLGWWWPLRRENKKRQPWKQGFAKRARNYERSTTSSDIAIPLIFSCSMQWTERNRILG